MRQKAIGLALALLFASGLFVDLSRAQSGALVVQTCGTLPLAYKPGATRSNTVDVNGNACVSGSISATSSATATAAAPSYSEGQVAPFSQDLAGNLRVLASINTTGLATSALQTTINTTLGSPYQAGGALPLPSGASTSANQSTALTDFGAPGATACTTDTGSCSFNQQLQRMAQNLTTINTTILTLQGTKNAGAAAANSLLAGLVYNSSPLTLTTTQQASLQGDANGYLKVNVAAAQSMAPPPTARQQPILQC